MNRSSGGTGVDDASSDASVQVLADASNTFFHNGEYVRSFETLRMALERFDEKERDDPSIRHNLAVLRFFLSCRRGSVLGSQSSPNGSEGQQDLDSRIAAGVPTYCTVLDCVRSGEYKSAIAVLERALSQYCGDRSDTSVFARMEPRVALHLCFLLIDLHVSVRKFSKAEETGNRLRHYLSHCFERIQNLDRSGGLDRIRLVGEGIGPRSSGVTVDNLASGVGRMSISDVTVPCLAGEKKSLLSLLSCVESEEMSCVRSLEESPSSTLHLLKAMTMDQYSFLVHLYKAKVSVHLLGDVADGSYELSAALVEWKAGEESSHGPSGLMGAADSTENGGFDEPVKTDVNSVPSLPSPRPFHYNSNQGYVDVCAALFLRANVEWMEGNSRKAMEALNLCDPQVLKLGAGSAGTALSWMYLNNMGCIHHKLRHHSVALHYFGRAYREYSKFVSNRSGVGKSSSGRFVDRSGDLLYNLGLSFLRVHRPLSAFMCFHKAGRSLWSVPGLWLHMAEAIMQNRLIRLRKESREKQKARIVKQANGGDRSLQQEIEIVGKCEDSATSSNDSDIDSMAEELLKDLQAEPTLAYASSCLQKALQLALPRAGEKNEEGKMLELRQHLLAEVMYVSLGLDDPYLALRCFALLSPSIHAACVRYGQEPSTSTPDQSGAPFHHFLPSVPSTPLSYGGPQSSVLSAVAPAPKSKVEYLSRVYASEAFCMLNQPHVAIQLLQTCWVPRDQILASRAYLRRRQIHHQSAAAVAAVLPVEATKDVSPGSGATPNAAVADSGLLFSAHELGKEQFVMSQNHSLTLPFVFFQSSIFELADPIVQRNVLVNLCLAATALNDCVSAQLYLSQALPFCPVATQAFLSAVTAELLKGNGRAALEYLKPRWPMLHGKRKEVRRGGGKQRPERVPDRSSEK